MSKSNLVLHCGANHVSRADLLNMPDPKPISSRHAPLHHGEFLCQVEDALTEAGYAITDAGYGLSPNGAQFFGALTIEHADLVGFNGGEFALGLRGSHDHSFAREIASGSRVFVCDNLAFNGAQRLATRQTTNLHRRLPLLLQRLIQSIAVEFKRITCEFDWYRKAEIADRVADAMIVSMYRRGAITATQIPAVINEWDSPSFDEHAEDGPSVWRLFNAATYVLRPANHSRGLALAHLPEKTAQIRAVCNAQCGLSAVA